MISYLKKFYARGQWSWAVILLFPLLAALSVLFSCAALLRRFLYRRGALRSYRPKAAVISVGNMTLGGSGKTPMAIFLAENLSRGGKRVAVVLRGYKKPLAATGLGSHDYDELGDEAALIKERLKGRIRVFSSKDRVGVARGLDAQEGCDVLVLDDGFQHLALQRDLDIVMVDAARPFGNGWVLPAGPLREPLCALRRADILCVSRANEADRATINAIKERLARINPRALLIESVHLPVGLSDLATGRERSLGELRGKGVGIFCGIANPSSFEAAVAHCGAKILLRRSFEDHYLYSSDDLASLMKEGAAAGVQAWVTTEKDAQRVKNMKWGEHCVLALKMDLEVTDGAGVFSGRLSAL